MAIPAARIAPIEVLSRKALPWAMAYLVAVMPFCLQQTHIRFTGIGITSVSILWFLGGGWRQMAHPIQSLKVMSNWQRVLVGFFLMGFLWMPLSEHWDKALELAGVRWLFLLGALLGSAPFAKDLFEGRWQSRYGELFFWSTTALNLLIFRRGIGPLLQYDDPSTCYFCIIQILIPMHRPFYGLYLAVSIGLGVGFLANRTLQVGIKLLIGLSMALSGAIFLLALPKSALLGVICGFCLLTLYWAWQHRHQDLIKYGSVVGLLVGLGVMGLALIKLLARSDYNWSITTSAAARYELWQASWLNIKEWPVWLIGTGLGDEWTLIAEKRKLLKQVPLDAGADFHNNLQPVYNSHNQFLSEWLHFGVLGVMVLVLLYALPLRKAWQAGDRMLLGLLPIFIFGSLTEDILSRESGIMLFALMLPLIARKGYHSSETHRL